MRTLSLIILLAAGCRAGDKPGKGGDGQTDTGGLDEVDGDGDGFPASDDCDDNDASINDGATEVCDGIDNDCDGDVDEGVTGTFYDDTDGDGYGDPEAVIEECSQPEGTVTAGTDCNDADAEIHPAASERCDGIDNDCDEAVDEDVLSTWYADVDGDGWGDPDALRDDCDPPEGFVDNDDDCDDTTAEAGPDQEEVCDEIDNDCDGTVDEPDAIGASTWYTDADGDSYGDPDSATVACDAPPSSVSDSSDCDDTEAAVNPAATEICDGIDNDCDAAIDDADSSVDLSTGGTWYTDADSDTHGDGTSPVQACNQPSGTVSGTGDCNDASAAVNPDATEICNSIDDDCDSLVDDDDPGVDLSTGSTFYDDDDSDGYGDASSSTQACSQPTGTVTDATDCDDSLASVNPGASELCNGRDDDCDSDADEGVLGSGASCAATSCLEILDEGSSTGDDAYWLEGASGSTFEAWCDMTEDGGGWTLVGSVVNDSSRNWSSYAVFTDTTTFGSIVNAQSADFKSEAMSEIAGDDLLVVTDDYAFAFYTVLDDNDLATWIAGEYDSAVCNSTYYASGADWYDGLTATQAAAQNLIVRPWDNNATCFPGSNENVLLGFQNADCCWAGGLGNAPNGQATWRTHDLSLLKSTNMTASSCTAGSYPCNANGYYLTYASFCYDTSCKVQFAEVYVR